MQNALDSANHNSNTVRQKYSLKKQLEICTQMNQRTLVKIIDTLSSTKPSSSDDTMEAGVEFAKTVDRLGLSKEFPKECKAADPMVQHCLMAHLVKLRGARKLNSEIWKDHKGAYKHSLPEKEMDELADIGDEKACEYPALVAKVLSSGPLGSKMYSYCAKACLEAKVSSVLSEGIRQALGVQPVTKATLQNAYADISQKIAAMKVSPAIIGRHQIQLTFFNVPMGQFVKSLDEEFDYETGKGIKENGVHCGLNRLNVENALAGCLF